MAQNFPYEFQTSFGEADEKAQLAQLLAKIAQQQSPGQGRMVGNIFVKPNPLQYLSSMLAQVQAGRLGQQAQRERLDVMRRMAGAEQGEKSRIAELITGRMPQTAAGDYGPGEAPTVGPQTSVSADPLQASRVALASSFPNVQKMGEQLRQQLSSQFSAMAPHATPESLMASGGDPTRLAPKPPEKWSDLANVAPPGAPEPIYGSRDQTGKYQFAPKPAQQNVTVGGKADVEMLKREHERITDPKVQERIQAAQKSLEAGTAAWNVLATTPINLGIDSDIKTFAQKLGRVVGVEPDARAPATELYTSFIIPQIANIIKMFGAGTGISDQDRKAAERALALATREPKMLEVALAYGLRGAYKELQGFENDLRRGAGIARGLGVDPRFFERDLQYGFTVPKGVDFPENFLEPSAMETWATRRLKGQKEPGPSPDLKLSPQEEEAVRRWLR